MIAETDGRMPESRIYLAAPLTIDELRADFAPQIATQQILEWDAEKGLRAVEREVLGSLVLLERPANTPDPGAVTSVLLEAITASKLSSSKGMDCASISLNWNARPVTTRFRHAASSIPGERSLSVTFQPGGIRLMLSLHK